jgi:hypothetical protein
MTTYDEVRQEAERAEHKANQFFAAETSKHAALQAAGGLASNKTLRDEFAMAALSSIGYCPDKPELEAKFAYQIADAMLEARKTPKGDV